jgi:hypothetical protein
MRSTPPSVTCLCFKALSDWHYWHLGEIASCQATMAEGISLAKELIEFDPEKEGLPKEGNVYLKIQDRFFELDMKLRMLAPHELALAQGFRKGYRFVGNKTQVVKQIGNAVPRRLESDRGSSANAKTDRHRLGTGSLRRPPDSCEQETIPRKKIERHSHELL